MPDPARRPWFWRFSLGHLAVGLIVMLVTATLIWEVRSRSTDALEGARRADLVTMLDQLTQETRRLQQEKADLEETRRELRSGADASRVAREEAQRRLDALAILAGTVPATGPGIVVRIQDPRGGVDGALLLDCIEELRDAGAEAIEVNDAHRVVAATWFGTSDGAVTVDGMPVARPLVIEAIGDPHALEEGLRFRGGIVSQIRSDAVGGAVDIARSDALTIGSLAPAATPGHATPHR